MQSFERHTPANVLATSTKYGACHDFHNVSDSLHLPRKLTFLTSACAGFLAPAMHNDVHVRKRTRTPGKTTPSKLRKPRRRLCASLRSRNQHRISKRHSCADETTGSERAPRWAPDLYTYRKNPFSVATVWGTNLKTQNTNKTPTPTHRHCKGTEIIGCTVTPSKPSGDAKRETLSWAGTRGSAGCFWCCLLLTIFLFRCKFWCFVLLLWCFLSF